MLSFLHNYLYMGPVVLLEKTVVNDDGVLYPNNKHFLQLCLPHNLYLKKFMQLFPQNQDIQIYEKIIYLGLKNTQSYVDQPPKTTAYCGTFLYEDLDKEFFEQQCLLDIETVKNYLSQNIPDLINIFKSFKVTYGIMAVSHSQSLC